MSYTPTKWEDHVLSDNSYTLKQNSDGTHNINAAGKVVQKGTPMSAENFNHMEDGISTADKNALDALEQCDDLSKNKANSSHTHKYAGSSTSGGSATSANKAKRLIPVVSQPHTSGTSNKFTKLATIELSAAYIGKTYKLFVVDAANGSHNAEVYIQARGGLTTGSYVAPPSLRVNALNWSKSIYFLMYTGWSIELWCGCNITDITALEIFEECNDESGGVTIQYESPLIWQTDAPTSGTKVSAIDAFNNYLSKSGGIISNANYAEALKINRTSTLTNAQMCSIDYLFNGTRLGLIGFDTDSKLRIRNSQNTDTSTITADGILKTAGSGKLLYSGTISATSGSITIENLWDYSTLLFEFHNMTPTSTIRPQSLSIMIPVQYVNGSSYTARGNIIDGLSGVSLTSGATTFLPTSFTGYVTFTKSSEENTVTLASQSILGTIKVYSII